MNITSIKWLYSGLLISIAVNVFAVGYFIGKPPSADLLGSPLSQTPEIHNAFKNLPTGNIENRQQIIELKKRKQQEIIANALQIRQLRLQISVVIQQDPLDQQQLAILFEKIYQLSSQNIKLAQQGVYETIILLPLSDRIKIAKLLVTSNRTTKKPSTDKNA